MPAPAAGAAAAAASPQLSRWLQTPAAPSSALADALLPLLSALPPAAGSGGAAVAVPASGPAAATALASLSALVRHVAGGAAADKSAADRRYAAALAALALAWRLADGAAGSSAPLALDRLLGQLSGALASDAPPRPLRLLACAFSAHALLLARRWCVFEARVRARAAQCVSPLASHDRILARPSARARAAAATRRRRRPCARSWHRWRSPRGRR